jgi:hypothetical protein
MMADANLVMEFIRLNPAPSVAAGIVVLGLLVIGLKDLLRFSFVRAGAIASVCFRQSIRRRVLWITPLVIVGVVVVTQFQKPIDAQDAVRQTTQYCLFATGLLVSLVTIILACTNLPQEIENRVIYTVATKPVTRLEIVVGKVMGFAHISFWILFIMGAFTWGYLSIRDWRLRSEITARLSSGMVDEISRPTLEYYRDRGTLHARQLGIPAGMGFFSREPKSDEDRWIRGDGEQQILARFRIDRAKIPVPEAAPAAPVGPGLAPSAPPPGILVLSVNVTARPRADAPPPPPTTQPAAKPVPHISLDILNSAREAIIPSSQLGFGSQPLNANGKPLQIYVLPEMLDKVVPPGTQQMELYLAVMGDDDQFEYTAETNGFAIFVPETSERFMPISDVIFASRSGPFGLQLKGDIKGKDARVAVMQFRDQHLASALNSYPFELRVGVESAGSDDEIQDAGIKLVLDFVNRKTGFRHDGIKVFPENNRPSYFDVPAPAVAGGDFDVIVHMRSGGWLGLRGGTMASLKLVAADEPFVLNLAKSLAVLWLMSLLITIISVFCSTFLSWPIAVLLTVVILFGRWGTEQLGDMQQPGLGRQVVNDMFKGSSAATSRAVSETVDRMVKTLGIVASVLPDISQFSAMEHMQRGMAMPLNALLAPLWVVLIFGLPLLVLAYVFFKYKEVAP